MRLLLFILFIGYFSAALFPQTSVVSSVHHQRVTQKIIYFIDSSAKCGAADVINESLNPIENVVYVNGSVKFKAANVKYWGKIEIVNDTKKDLVEVIYFSRNFLDSVYCFIENKGVISELGSSGDRIYSEEQQLINRVNAFYFHIEAGETVNVAFSFKENRSIVTDVYLTDIKSFLKNNDLEHLFIGTYFGVLLFLAIAAIIAYFFTDRKYLLYYTLVLIAGMISNTTSNGTWHSIFMGRFPAQAIWVHSLFVIVWILSFTLFVSEFLRIKEYSEILFKRIKFIFTFFLLLSAVLLISSIFVDYSFLTSLMYLCIIIIELILSIFILKMVKYNRINSIIIACAFFPTFISIGVYFLVRSGYIHNDFLLNFSNQIGGFFMLVTISFAIGIQIKKEFEQRIELLSKLAVQESVFQTNLSVQREKQQHNIANLLHDSFGVKLKHIRSLIESNQLSFAQYEIGILGEEIRDLSHSLSPTILDFISLREAVTDLTVKMSTPTFEIIVNSDLDKMVLSKDKKSTLYNVIQELINNTIKHAEANKLIIQMSVFEGEYYISAEDNGLGFDIEKSTHAGLGIQSVKNRIALMKGICEISSSLGHGTMWTVKVPILD